MITRRAIVGVGSHTMSPQPPPDHPEALRHERRAQLRGLLFLALAVFVLLVLRARPLLLFQHNWWRP